jgi:hypothetical protein
MGEVMIFPSWRNARSVERLTMNMITNYVPPHGEIYLTRQVGEIVEILRSMGWSRMAAEREGVLLKRSVHALLEDLRANAPRIYA